MHNDSKVSALPARPDRPPASPAWLKAALLTAGLTVGGAGHAFDWGPFTLTGFTKAELTNVSRTCPDCQVAKDVSKEYRWGDQVAAGKSFGADTTHVVLFQPWLAANFKLGGGFKLTGLLSQRWRDGRVDIPGFLYDKSVALSHEDYGRLAVGAMTSRSWSLADFPYGSHIGVSDAWASSGAGYGLLGHAVRYTSRPLDVLGGDLVLEATYDAGNSRFKIHKPRFVELYGQYRRGNLLIDATYQDARNGNAQNWGHGPFDGLFYDPSVEVLLGSSGQSIAMVMARYQLNINFELLGGARRNRWTGAHAVIVRADPRGDIWNNPFNVDWGGSLVFTNPNGSSRILDNPGYPAVSVDLSGGLRYRDGPWSAHAGFAYLGKAKTSNPSERGQSNAALINSVGLNYDFRNGLQIYGLAGMVHYKRLGLSPMSMPGNSAFTNIDSRVSKRGDWFGIGAVYVF